jgi:hypothetical protein
MMLGCAVNVEASTLWAREREQRFLRVADELLFFLDACFRRVKLQVTFEATVLFVKRCLVAAPMIYASSFVGGDVAEDSLLAPVIAACPVFRLQSVIKKA